MNVGGSVTVTNLHDYIEDGKNNLRRVHDSVQHINTTYHSSYIKASSLAIPLTDTIVNDQVAVTDPHDYTEEGQHNLRLVHDRVQHINTTFHSSSIKASSLAIPLADANVNGQVTVTDLHDYTEEGRNNLRRVHDSV